MPNFPEAFVQTKRGEACRVAMDEYNEVARAHGPKSKEALLAARKLQPHYVACARELGWI